MSILGKLFGKKEINSQAGLVLAFGIFLMNNAVDELRKQGHPVTEDEMKAFLRIYDDAPNGMLATVGEFVSRDKLDCLLEYLAIMLFQCATVVNNPTKVFELMNKPGLPISISQNEMVNATDYHLCYALAATRLSLVVASDHASDHQKRLVARAVSEIDAEKCSEETKGLVASIRAQLHTTGGKEIGDVASKES